MSGRGDFWARRKAAVAAEEASEVEAEIARDEAEARAALEEKPDAEILSELNLPKENFIHLLTPEVANDDENNGEEAYVNNTSFYGACSKMLCFL